MGGGGQGAPPEWCCTTPPGLDGGCTGPELRRVEDPQQKFMGDLLRATEKGRCPHPRM